MSAVVDIYGFCLLPYLLASLQTYPYIYLSSIAICDIEGLMLPIAKISKSLGMAMFGGAAAE